MATSEFAVLANSCDGGIAPGDKCYVLERFNPTATGQRNGRLTISTDTGSAASALLSGQGVANPCATVACGAPDGGSPRTCVGGTCQIRNANSLLIWPDILTMRVGESRTLRSFIIYSDGSTEEVRTEKWVSSKPTTAAFDSASKLTARAPGSVEITTTFYNLRATGMTSVR
jgi:hypothetical protein